MFYRRKIHVDALAHSILNVKSLSLHLLISLNFDVVVRLQGVDFVCRKLGSDNDCISA